MVEKVLLYMFLAITLAGCAHKVQTVNWEIRQQKSLSFLKDGRTTKAEVFRRLGKMYAQFEEGSIVAYRLNDKYQVVGRSYASGGHLEWGTAEYSLVLVFDEYEIMQRHSLVRVR